MPTLDDINTAVKNGAKDVWDTATSKEALIIAGGLGFAGMCLISGGFIAGVASTCDIVVSAGSAAAAKLSAAAAATWPHITEATAAAAALSPAPI